MTLIKDDAINIDPFVYAADDGALPPSNTPVIVSLDSWLNNRAQLAARPSEIGVVLKSDQSPSLISQDLDRLAVIVLEFPTFSDGRGFSYARSLREQYGFTGEIRARGHIIRDQYLFLHRCGVNAIEVNSNAALDHWNEALEEFTLFYQNTIDDRATVMSRRHDQSLSAA